MLSVAEGRTDRVRWKQIERQIQKDGTTAVRRVVFQSWINGSQRGLHAATTHENFVNNRSLQA